MKRALSSTLGALGLLGALTSGGPLACAGGDCSALDFHPIDRERKCLHPAVQSGCEKVESRAVVCSVEPGGSMYLSREGRTYPDARRCTATEEAEVELTKLQACP